MTKTDVTRRVMSDGSYGLRSRHNGDPLLIWFCGAWMLRGVAIPRSQAPGYHGNSSHPSRQTTPPS